MNDSTHSALNKTNRRILRELQQDGRVSNVDLAARVGISESPCFRRVRQLEADGLITGYSAHLDQRKIGLPVTAYVQVTIDKHDEQIRSAFLRQVYAEEHIVECHAMTGASDYLLKVVAQSIDHFSELSMNGILRWPGVQNIESQFSLNAIKVNGALPLVAPG
ncbi:AsnC family transcriptional regulator [Oceanococcus atlanticus]|uniref:AsnC family transcriptional regulator n=1 Tax=Oceanococcus atlanticus TaxID=1317117 RepID=A0A1Y1SDK3_9GAMM|nr:Lrp/AsnC family transcriptional regulator [Oceanococcus atlanticus]ORE87085.1 AsnC family transcriptional regulator [Oceanococcus atlanticus]